MSRTCIPCRRRPRSGAAMIWALIVLSVLGVTSAMAAKQVAMTRRALDLRQNRLQAVWLARGGAELAAARLLAGGDYAGESVEPIPEGQVRITVEKDRDKPDAYRVRCEARYPAGDRREVSVALTRTATRRTDGGKVSVELVDPEAAEE